VFGRERERELAAALAGYGATVALLTDVVERSTRDAIVLPRVPDLAAAVLQILPVQLLVSEVARARGLEIGPLSRHQEDTKVSP
jgi:fructoselysine-6-P-deglycase FrlB-like protein